MSAIALLETQNATELFAKVLALAEEGRQLWREARAAAVAATAAAVAAGGLGGDADADITGASCADGGERTCCG